MGQTRLRVAAALLGAFSLVASAFAAPLVLNVTLQPDSASGQPGGVLDVYLLNGGEPLAGHNVTATAADGSWTDRCTTDDVGHCAFEPLTGTKGTVSVNDTARTFFLPKGNEARWRTDLALEDDGTPLGLGPRDIVPTAVLLVANLFGLVGAIALYRRTAPRLALLGVGLSLFANLIVFLPVGVAISGFAGYALVKDAHLFGAVPLDDADQGEEEE